MLHATAAFARPRALALLSTLLTAVTLTGCASDRPAAPAADEQGLGTSVFGPAGVDLATDTAYPDRADAITLTDTGERLFVYNGHNGEPVTGEQLRQRMRQADVVLLSEVHDDPIAHRLQARFVREALGTGSGSLSLEMLTRKDQPALAELGTGSRAVEEQLSQTSLSDWPHWREFYLPSILAARRSGRPVVGANAPVDYVRSARVRGYAFLESLDQRQQQLFALPDPGAQFPQYRQRFEQAMAGHGGVNVDDPTRQPQIPEALPTTQPGRNGPATQPGNQPQSGRERMSAHQPATQPDRGLRPGPATQLATRPATRPAARPSSRDPQSMDAWYDAQLVWDATMADSIITARRRYGAPVVHLVGNFHSDYNAAMTQMLEERGLSVLSISFVPVDSQRLRPQDAQRAGVVIYTGADRPLPEPQSPATRRAGSALEDAEARTPPVAGRGPAAPATVPATLPATRATTLPTTRGQLRSR